MSDAMTTDPWRPYPTRPRTDGDSASVLDEAVETLTTLRSPLSSGDAGAELHALVSLIAHAKGRLAFVVADARDQEHTWGEIARQLGCSRLSAVVRYAPQSKNRRRPLDPD
ncbi:MAG TPA: hypothetical protein VNC61_13645 [Acidimicrobiales bacterium]|nr:hypothetical protein [Acidimicrobiales bacterium]